MPYRDHFTQQSGVELHGESVLSRKGHLPLLGFLGQDCVGTDRLAFDGDGVEQGDCGFDFFGALGAPA